MYKNAQGPLPHLDPINYSCFSIFWTMSTPYELIRLNFRPDKIRLNKIKILRSPNILITVILTLDTPPLY